MQGIILAGGTGSRLWPSTATTNKHLLPIYDKPMIYYPLGTLMLMGIREVFLVTNEKDIESFERLLGNGSRFGISIKYCAQTAPLGIPQAISIAEAELTNDSFAVILGDNFFHGSGLGQSLSHLDWSSDKAHIFLTETASPELFGIATLNDNEEILSIEEKPTEPKSDLAVTGLYVFPYDALREIHELKLSSRGELEVADLLNVFLKKKLLIHHKLLRGSTWLDAGNPSDLIDASIFVSVLQNRQRVQIACIEEIAFRNSWINIDDLKTIITATPNGIYRDYLSSLLEN